LDGSNSVRNIDLLHLHGEVDMSEIIKYKRYMVFSWCEYDNQKPFENVDGSFDTAEEALDLVNSNDLIGRNEEDGAPLYCIFDRIEGVMI
jgi:hypothetical protein